LLMLICQQTPGVMMQEACHEAPPTIRQTLLCILYTGHQGSAQLADLSHHSCHSWLHMASTPLSQSLYHAIPASPELAVHRSTEVPADMAELLLKAILCILAVA